MTYILDFTNLPSELPPKRRDLKLILWAGDGEHDGVSDVRRLQQYDVFLCLGFDGPQLQKNIADLTGDQILCKMDVHNKNHMDAFRQIFYDSFVVMDADYYGNTPILPLEIYLPVLAPSGTAYHTEGINSLVMPQEDMLNTLEIFAPLLNPYGKEQRRWSIGILELAKRDNIPASHIWASPDLKHSWYNHTREMQEKFVAWQKIRNPAWPACADTLEEHCDTLSAKTLCVRISERYTSPEVLEQNQYHMQHFHDYLVQKIAKLLESQPQFSLRRVATTTDYALECMKAKDIYERILTHQNVLKWLSSPVPPGLVCIIGCYRDMRYVDSPLKFGAYYVKDI